MKEPSPHVTFLDWDSEFFGVRIASMTANARTDADFREAIDWCTDNNVDCLYYLVSATDTAASGFAEDIGFRLMDIRVQMETNPTDFISTERSTDATLSFRQADHNDLEDLRAIASVCYRGITRFYADPDFPDTRCDDLYALWIEKSCDEFADIVVVAECDGAVAGFISVKMTLGQTIGKIGVMGVGAEFRGRGIANMLILNALEWMVDQNATSATVVTQGRNLAGQRAYQRAGFITNSTALWYHKWFK